MSKNDEVKSRIMAFVVPADITAATKTAAANDLCSMSYICRRALVNDLRERGLLAEKENAA